ncbi:unnamed protein product [Victoria cruziana]
MVKKKSWLLCFFLQFHLFCSALANGGILGGIIAQSPPGFSSSRLYDAYLALQAWKSAITRDPFGITASWAGPNVCSYKGIFCSDSLDMVSGQVVASIDLNHGYLEGSLVKELSYLTDLSILHLNTNRFTGTIPDSFSALVYLSELDLSNNLLSGPFPSVILRLPSLIYLDLRYNHFDGGIPDELFGMNLDAIFLNNNEFEGQIPMSLGNSPASVITLANNKFSGNLPTSFGYVGSRLKEILFMNNQLTGCIPEGVGFLSQMVVLDLSYNSLSGGLPDSLTCLSGIEVFNIAHNEFSGMLPDIICSLSSLANLTVSYNFFSGISEQCSRLVFKNVGFDLSGNCIPGRLMQRPQPQCSGFQGGLNCMRIPSPKPFLCRPLLEEPAMNMVSNFLPPSFPFP